MMSPLDFEIATNHVNARLSSMESKQPHPVRVSICTNTTPSYKQVILGRYSAHVKDVEEFRGVPYGHVSKRWTHSTVRTHLPNDVFDATRYGPRCPQPEAPNTSAPFQFLLDFPKDVDESELECLNLIVTRPAQTTLIGSEDGNNKALLPVYVYIHGGAFAFGAASDPMWDSARLVSRSMKAGNPIIVVRINYRLNIFGFLASDELARSDGCNFGFFDQVTALKWIRANIQAFGGDPNKITLGGQSAGGTAVYIHALRALSAEVDESFRSCIMQSPAAGLCGPCSMEEAEERWNILSQYLKLSEMSFEQRLDHLRSLSVEKLLEIVADLGWSIFKLVEDSSLLPTPSNKAETSTSGIAQSISDVSESAKRTITKPLHILSTITSCEASVFIHTVNAIRTFDDLISMVQKVPSYEKLLLVYGISSNTSITDIHNGLYLLFTDILFTVPARQGLRTLAKSGTRHPVRLSKYLFNMGNPFSGPFHRIANHCVDIIYLFDGFHNALRAVDEHEQEHEIPGLGTSAELVNDIQTRFVDFIYAEPERRRTESMVEDVETVVFDERRKSRLLDSSTSPELQSANSRLDDVEELWESALALGRVIVASMKH